MGWTQELVKRQCNGRRTINGAKQNLEEEPSKKIQNPEYPVIQCIQDPERKKVPREERRRPVNEDQDKIQKIKPKKKEAKNRKSTIFLLGECFDAQGYL